MTFLQQTTFVTYEPETGAIIGWGETSAGAIVDMKLRGHLIVEGHGRPETHRVDLGTLTIVEKNPEPEQFALDLESAP